jgi:hypothetical protein
MVTLWVQWASFNCPVTVCIEDTGSPFHGLSSVEASKGTTIFLPPRPATDAVKCFRFEEHIEKADTFGKALKEFVLYKIASGAGVGPKLSRYCGFDLVVFRDCIEFSMEKCVGV